MGVFVILGTADDHHATREARRPHATPAAMTLTDVSNDAKAAAPGANRYAGFHIPGLTCQPLVDTKKSKRSLAARSAANAAAPVAQPTREPLCKWCGKSCLMRAWIAAICLTRQFMCGETE